MPIPRSLAILGGIVLLASMAQAQLDLGRLRPPKIDVGLQNLFKQPTPIFAKLDSADPGLLGLSSFDPQEAASLLTMPKNSDGDYVLPPGLYSITRQSFCVRGYTAGPNKGEGYLWAPLSGAYPQIFENIVTRYSLQEDVSQESAQTLIWALLARTKPSKIGGAAAEAMVKLLKPEEIAMLEGRGMEFLEDKLLRPLLDSADRTLRPLYEAENKVRQMAAEASKPFEEFERLMVTPPREDSNIPAFQRGNWLSYEGGAMIRFLPNGYDKVEVQIYVPPTTDFWWDKYGRIVGAKWGDDSLVATVYDDAFAPVVDPLEPAFVCFWVKEHVYWTADPRAPGGWKRASLDEGYPMVVWDPRGLTKPLQKGSSFFAVLAASLSPSSPFDDRKVLALQAIQDARQAREEAKKAKENYEKALKEYENLKERAQGRSGDSSELTNIDRYRDGLDAVREGNKAAQLEWLADQKKKEAEGWADAYRKIRDLGKDEAEDRERDPGKRNPGSPPPPSGSSPPPPPSSGGGRTVPPPGMGAGGSSGRGGTASGQRGSSTGGRGGGSRSGGGRSTPGRSGGAIAPANPWGQTLMMSGK